MMAINCIYIKTTLSAIISGPAAALSKAGRLIHVMVKNRMLIYS